MSDEKKRELIEMLLSWVRVFIATMLVQFMAGVTDWKMIVNAGIASVIPMAIRWLDPQDKTFGRKI